MALNTNALCTVEDVREYFDIDEQQDNLIEDLINRVSTQFENYCDRNFYIQSYTEYHDGGTELFWTDQYPITSVSGVYESSSWDWSTAVDSTTYRVVNDDRAVALNSGKWTSGREAIKVIYTAGLHSSMATVPLDLRLACIKEVSKQYRDRRKKGLVSEDVNKSNTSHTFQFVLKEFDPETMATLERYKRLYIC